MKSRNELRLFDLDGTQNDIDVLAALDGGGTAEVRQYIASACAFVADETGIPGHEVFNGVKAKIENEVFPNRAKHRYWAEFPGSDKSMIKIAPAVDHFLLTQRAMELFLAEKAAAEGVESDRGRKINAFITKRGWQYEVFKTANNAAQAEAEMSPDAISALQEELRSDKLVCIITNSSTQKAVDLLAKAGLPHELGAPVRGRSIGVFGDAQKFVVDVDMPKTDGWSVDVSKHFGEDIKLDLRRCVFRAKVRSLMESLGVENVDMFSDITTMDNYPLQVEFGDRARHFMKTNPTSAPEEIAAALELLRARVSGKLSELVQ